jgi:hypothetical protein
MPSVKTQWKFVLCKNPVPGLARSVELSLRKTGLVRHALTAFQNSLKMNYHWRGWAYQ